MKGFLRILLLVSTAWVFATILYLCKPIEFTNFREEVIHYVEETKTYYIVDNNELVYVSSVRSLRGESECAYPNQEVYCFFYDDDFYIYPTTYSKDEIIEYFKQYEIKRLIYRGVQLSLLFIGIYMIYIFCKTQKEKNT